MTIDDVIFIAKGLLELGKTFFLGLWNIIPMRIVIIFSWVMLGIKIITESKTYRKIKSNIKGNILDKKAKRKAKNYLKKYNKTVKKMHKKEERRKRKEEKKTNNKKNENEKITETKEIIENEEKNQKNNFINKDIKKDLLPYKKVNLLTNNELEFYQKIKPICEKNNIHIISKVRLADIVNVEKVFDEYTEKKFLRKIWSRHIDFVLCNPENLEPIALIELDDKSHDRPERIRSDNLKNEICKKLGIKLIRTLQDENIEQKLIENEIIK